MILYTTHTSTRLQHMADWLGTYLFKKPLIIVTRKDELPGNIPVLNYSDEQLSGTSFTIKPHSLLFETGIKQHDIIIKKRDQLPYFFETGDDFHFDILAASFYLIQRYEEYLPYNEDMYGRYAHENSVAFREQFLHLPLVDLWLNQFKEKLKAMFTHFQVHFVTHAPDFVPTYDVDIAFSYKGKGLLRNTGGFIKSAGHIPLFRERWKVLKGVQKDPFDVYDELDSLHHKYYLQPVFFLLLANKSMGLDKNINPNKTIYRELVKELSENYKTGIHLSDAAASNPDTMLSEKTVLQEITGIQTTANRMHYLKFKLPATFELLERSPLMIREEYSMGYGSINGFRASTSFPYYWFNLRAESSVAMKIFPFCYMDANSIFEQKDTPQNAFKEMKNLYASVKQAGGSFISIFHNHLIGLGTEGRLWMNIYKEFLKYQSG